MAHFILLLFFFISATPQHSLHCTEVIDIFKTHQQFQQYDDQVQLLQQLYPEFASQAEAPILPPSRSELISSSLWIGGGLLFMLLPTAYKAARYYYLKNWKNKQLKALEKQEENCKFPPGAQYAGAQISLPEEQRDEESRILAATPADPSTSHTQAAVLTRIIADYAQNYEELETIDYAKKCVKRKYKQQYASMFPYSREPFSFLHWIRSDNHFDYITIIERLYTFILTAHVHTNLLSCARISYTTMTPLNGWCTLLACSGVYIASGYALDAIMNPHEDENRAARIARFDRILWLTGCLAANGIMLYHSPLAQK